MPTPSAQSENGRASGRSTARSKTRQRTVGDDRAGRRRHFELRRCSVRALTRQHRRRMGAAASPAAQSDAMRSGRFAAHAAARCQAAAQPIKRGPQRGCTTACRGGAREAARACIRALLRCSADVGTCAAVVRRCGGRRASSAANFNTAVKGASSGTLKLRGRRRRVQRVRTRQASYHCGARRRTRGTAASGRTSASP
jgi:hypothetical protein